jgi:membrane protease YdiL (CAAX protease family)
MDRRLALGALLAIPALYLLGRLLSAGLGPLPGAGLTLLVYWAGLGLALQRTQDPYLLRELLVAVRPGALVTAMLALPVLVLGAITLRLLGTEALPPHLVVAAALAALVHGTLEELFWRGALLPRLTPAAAAQALGLYWLFHLSWLGLAGALPEAGPLVLLLTPLALGGVWTAARLETGVLGASVLSHVGFALFLFVTALAQGWTLT